MPTVSVPGKEIQFFFTDTGAPGTVDEYTTFILVHGHSYHSGIRVPKALTARRHPLEELRVYVSGSDQERIALVDEAGVDLALAVDGIIQQCHLPATVTLSGWSLGNTFVLAAMASILSLPSETQNRLQSFIKTIILWDPPLGAMGLSKPPQAHVTALHGENITPAARGPVFGKLNFRHPDPSRKDTYADMPLDELRNIVDFSASARCDTILSDPAFTSVLSAVVEKALFDSRIRAAWKGTERRAEAAEGNAPITFRSAIEGANHFVMWEDPNLTLDDLIACTKA
ncbi:hypothetical protein B0H14DRAFT_3883659 [Mycena olivaceomarginata]|nr:hypothetical protein B0H14DRAFT_3883659 [Mycena olivaceomarginata]